MVASNSNKLAIVIPAFKERYFEETLNSLAQQTNLDFNLYVGDDNSPYNLSRICEKFSDKLKINYTRFSENIGPENLVLQWTRCVNLTKGEEWIWLFSDDDVADTNCVENFYRTIEADGGRFDIYRFSTIIIDGENKVVYTTPESPLCETSEEMAYNLLLGKRGNVMPDQIFSRRRYDASGGFVFTKYAQGADWAASMLFSKQTGIAFIPDSKIYWRNSGINISAKAKAIKGKTMVGHLQFIAWVVKHYSYLTNHNDSVTYQMMLGAASTNLIRIIILHYKGYNNSSIFQLATFMHSVLNYSYSETLKTLVFIRRRTIDKNKKVYRVLRKVKGYSQVLISARA